MIFFLFNTGMGKESLLIKKIPYMGRIKCNFCISPSDPPQKYIKLQLISSIVSPFYESLQLKIYV